jgi:arginyl-tRNA synthetase
VHVSFGSVLGQDRKMLRSRSGDAVKLIELLDEAIERAAAAVAEKNPQLDEATQAEVARMVGIGAVKYADLSVAHDSEYVFDLERMVALNGNTSRYLQYAAARLRSIFRRAGVDANDVSAAVKVVEPGERALALKLLTFGEVLSEVGSELEPHRLCTYLFDLAQTFSVFYEQCPVLKAEPELRESRLALCALTMHALVTGLELLGIESPETM